MKRARVTIVRMAISALVMVNISSASTYFFSTSESEFDPGVQNQGWWSDTKFNNNLTNDNYSVGGDHSSVEEIRNFFTFDLSSLTEEVVSVTLELTRFAYRTGAPYETLAFFDVSTDAELLNNNYGVNANIFNDLGSGECYGVFDVLRWSGISDQTISFSLNASALEDINSAAGGFFSIGGRMLTIDGSLTGANDESIFTNSGDGGIQHLIVETIPEPATLSLLALGAFLAGRRRK
jgi:hypothetical protein